MARRTNRVLLGLVCSNCGKQNYVTEKNRTNTPDKVVFKKYCNMCKASVEHKEKPRLK